MAKILENLFYTEDHEWVKVEGNSAYIGITDFAQLALGDIVFVELPEVGAEFAQNDAFGVIESVKAASDCYIPVSGTVVEINEELSDNPALLNEDAYGNWMIRVELSEPEQVEGLMNSGAYEELCGKEA